ncbi:uncharacterized protein TNCV_4106701 [Trichonephila clavipes]|nr:uncharacterized protein TNCV_4106701 [Trichonephila clavipes]
MSIVVKLKKDELKLVAEEIGLTAPKYAKRVDLKRLIEESDVFKEDYEFVKTVIEQVLEEIKTQESEQNGQIQLECLKLELAQLRTSANNNDTSLSGCEIETSIDVFIKSVRTLTIKVLSNSEGLICGSKELNSSLRKFWEIEEIDNKIPKNLENSIYKEHYAQTHKRDESGKYIVSKPLKKDINEPVKVYQLNMVSYGTASAQFLAMRTLKQIPIDKVENFPTAASVLCDGFYVDDV